jgi:membrane protein DedA with SNARE-associated domain
VLSKFKCIEVRRRPPLVDEHQFVLTAIEAALALGMPVPGESGLIGSALLAARGDLSIGGVLACVWAGAVLGDNIGYLIGRLAGRALGAGVQDMNLQTDGARRLLHVS